jgi:hypothetical protein
MDSNNNKYGYLLTMMGEGKEQARYVSGDMCFIYTYRHAAFSVLLLWHSVRI